MGVRRAANYLLATSIASGFTVLDKGLLGVGKRPRLKTKRYFINAKIPSKHWNNGHTLEFANQKIFIKTFANKVNCEKCKNLNCWNFCYSSRNKYCRDDTWNTSVMFSSLYKLQRIQTVEKWELQNVKRNCMNKTDVQHHGGSPEWEEGVITC